MVDMGKIYLYYKRHNDSVLGKVLKIKIDDKITAEINKNDIYELELADGQHNIKMYYCGWTEDELVGYIDENIVISGDTFFIYKGPATIYGKGKLIKNSYNNADDFKMRVKNINRLYKIIGICLFVIFVLYINQLVQN